MELKHQYLINLKKIINTKIKLYYFRKSSVNKIHIQYLLNFLNFIYASILMNQE